MVEAEEREREYAFECGRPFWGDVLSSERIDYRLLIVALEQELARIPDGLRWLQLVMLGESAWNACKQLRHGHLWFRRVMQACREIVLQ